MDDEQDGFKPITPAQYGYFGGPGTLLLPSAKTVAAVLKQVPARRVVTTDALRRRLAADPKAKVPYWRVVNQNGQLIDRFPGGAAAQAARLRAEGFEVDTSGAKPKLTGFKERLVQFE